jgi:hypothetical protein
MVRATFSGDFGRCGDRTGPVVNGIGAKLEKLVRRLTDALEAPRPTELDRKIATLLARSGGRLTDSMEREIFRKAFASDWSLPQ